MTYDWEGLRSIAEGTREWYQALDAEFWEISPEFAHADYPKAPPFSDLIDYSSIRNKDVLEIGCGMGAHAAVFAQAGANVIALDLTEKAVEMSNRRFQLFGISNARAVQADAEQLPFPDSSIDFVWSWGVIHHSSNTDRIVGEIYRALRPGGRAQIMIYHRNSTRYWIHGLYHAIILGKILKYKTLYAVNMTFTDGYIARHYSRGDCYNLFGKFSGIKTSVMDSGTPSIVFGWGRLSRILPGIFGPINRWINRRFGWFLVVDLVK